MPSLIVNYQNKREEKILKAFLNSFKMQFYTEKEEEKELVEAYKKIKVRKENAVPFNASRLKKS